MNFSFVLKIFDFDSYSCRFLYFFLFFIFIFLSLCSESIADVLVRANQLVSTIESMYSGENVLIISPDSDNLSVLQAALFDEYPDISLPKHARFSFENGEVRELISKVKPTELLATGQTQKEADIVYRKMKALRVGGNKLYVENTPESSWVDLWHLAVDNKSS